MTFDYGDEVIVKTVTSDAAPISRVGSVVAMTTIENVDLAEKYTKSVGTVLYTVELGDGSEGLFSADQLELLHHELR